VISPPSQYEREKTEEFNMPTYEYKCTGCDHHFEKFESITADPSKDCPSCGEDKAVRMISGGIGVIFKGSGFYSTDYRDSSYKSDKSSAESPAPACGAGGCAGGACGI